MTNTATRLITLIMLLQRRPNQKAKTLAKELGVSLRTLHRYFAMLDELGIPVYSERGPLGGFSLVRGYRMPPLIFTPEEATAVYLGVSMVNEIWGDLYQQAAQGAMAKLDNVLPEDQRQEVAWARRSLIATGMHRSEYQAMAPLLQKLRHAIREQRQILMYYRTRSQKSAQERLIDPYALVHRWGWWYMVGHCHLRKAIRCFRVDRILHVSVLENGFEMPNDFDVHQCLAQWQQEQPEVEIKLRFDAESEHLAWEDRTLWKDYQPQPDGSVEVTFMISDLEWALRLIFGYCGKAVVIAPDTLRQQVREHAKQIVEKHENSEQEIK